MNLFAWKGITHTGKTVKGRLQAHSLPDVQTQLLLQNIALLEAYPVSIQSSVTEAWYSGLTNAQLLDFFSTMALLLTSGIPLINTLDIMLSQASSKKLVVILQELKTSVSKGLSLATALSQFSRTFSPFVIHLVAAGEKTGHLGPVLDHLKNYLNVTITLRNQLKKALMMPIITLSFSLVLLWIILIFVIPHFSTLYQSLGCTVPTSTQYIIRLSQACASWWGLMIIASTLPIMFIVKQSFKHPLIRQKLHSIALYTPFLSTLAIQREVLRLLELLALFFKSGFPLTQALEHAQTSTNAPIFQNHIKHLLTMIIEGKTLSQGLEEIGPPFFDAHLVALVRVGEHANALGLMLEKTTTLYRVKLSETLHTLSTVAAPLFMIVVGVLIGSLMIFMYLPILNLGSLFGT